MCKLFRCSCELGLIVMEACAVRGWQGTEAQWLSALRAARALPAAGTHRVPTYVSHVKNINNKLDTQLRVGSQQN